MRHTDDMETRAIRRWPAGVWLPLVLLGIAAIAVVMVGVITTFKHLASSSDDDPYTVIVWFNRGTSRQAVSDFEKACGHASGAGLISAPARSRSGAYRGLFVVDVELPFGPDDERSNAVLDCVDHAPDVYDSVIPL